jgi:hypothetical protein
MADHPAKTGHRALGGEIDHVPILTDRATAVSFRTPVTHRHNERQRYERHVAPAAALADQAALT